MLPATEDCKFLNSESLMQYVMGTPFIPHHAYFEIRKLHDQGILVWMSLEVAGVGSDLDGSDNLDYK